jgi:HSP20 family molecular chaperone IbpA
MNAGRKRMSFLNGTHFRGKTKNMNSLKPMMKSPVVIRPASLAEHVARFSGGSLRRAGVIAAASLAAIVCAGPRATAASQPAATSTSLAHQAVDIQESPSSYTVTLDIPAQDASHLHVNLKGRTLRISSGQTSGGATFEQKFHLPEADALASPSITQNNGRVVISVPKAAPGSNPAPAAMARNFPAIQAAPVQAMPSVPTSGSMDAWAQQAIKQMAQMQRQMNAMMNSSMQADPFSMAASGFGGGVASSGGVSIEDKGQDYVIRAKGIDQSTKLDVSVDNGNLLKITSRNESSANGSSSNSYQMSSSTQIVTLPSPVQSDKMTTRRDGDDVLITLPKA